MSNNNYSAQENSNKGNNNSCEGTFITRRTSDYLDAGFFNSIYNVGDEATQQQVNSDEEFDESQYSSKPYIDDSELSFVNVINNHKQACTDSSCPCKKIIPYIDRVGYPKFEYQRTSENLPDEFRDSVYKFTTWFINDNMDE